MHLFFLFPKKIMAFLVVEHASHPSEIMTTNGADSINTVTPVLDFKHLEPYISKP